MAMTALATVVFTAAAIPASATTAVLPGGVHQRLSASLTLLVGFENTVGHNAHISNYYVDFSTDLHGRRLAEKLHRLI
jgi:hypothetical protein